MATKVTQGYKCDTCGKVLGSKSAIEKHEPKCGVQKLDNYMTGASKKSAAKPRKTGKSSKTSQTKVNEQYIGDCSRCGARITDEDRSSYGENFYECSKCGKTLRKKKK